MRRYELLVITGIITYFIKFNTIYAPLTELYLVHCRSGTVLQQYKYICMYIV